MRSFEVLDKLEINEATGILSLSTVDSAPISALVAMRKEGSYIAISASYGPLEFALRPRLNELARVLGRLRPVDTPQTPRQVGTGQAYIALGLLTDGTVLMRLTIVADATGHFSINLSLTDAVRAQLFDWLPVEPGDPGDS